MDWLNRTHVGDCRELLPAMAAAGVRVQTCVTSPPFFGLRDYGMAAQIGLENSPEAYVAELVAVFRAVREVLADNGTVWCNLGDSYAGGGTIGRNDAGRNLTGGGGNSLGSGNPGPQGTRPQCGKAKDLIGIPWRVAFALQADGWYLRSDIIWAKSNPMPESCKDRPTKSHEYLFLLSKQPTYYYDAAAIRERSFTSVESQITKRNKAPHKGQRDPGGHRETTGGFNNITQVYESRNRRTVWTIATTPFSGAHFACFPRALIEPCILAGSPPGGTVLDPFMGSGTTGQVATDLGRHFIGCELNPAYVALHEMRTTTTGMAI